MNVYRRSVATLRYLKEKVAHLDGFVQSDWDHFEALLNDPQGTWEARRIPFHRLWTFSVGLPGYVKSEWKDFEALLYQNPRPLTQETPMIYRFDRKPVL